MSWLEHICAKYAYNNWANAKVYTAAAALTDEQLSAERSGDMDFVFFVSPD